jgi:hypothetical protein
MPRLALRRRSAPDGSWLTFRDETGFHDGVGSGVTGLGKLPHPPGCSLLAGGPHAAVSDEGERDIHFQGACWAQYADSIMFVLITVAFSLG